MKKMLVSDYDGTFYIDNESIQKNIEEVNNFRKSGNLFVIATGRSYHDFKDEIKKYHITFDYLILNHGSVIVDNKRDTFKCYTIKSKVLLEINKFLDLYDDKIKEKNIYGVRRNNVSNKYINITKVGIELYDFNTALILANELNQHFSEDINAYAIKGMRYILVEIVPNGINKGVAIEEIAIKEKITKENIYTIGNGANDLEMLENYNGYGMASSEEVVINNMPKLYSQVYQLINDLEPQEKI